MHIAQLTHVFFALPTITFPLTLAPEDNNRHDFCKMLSEKVHDYSEVPAICKHYKALFKEQHEHSNVTRNVYAGMSPGEAIDAMRAKDEGHLNSAQIKRRMTERKNGRVY